jgi:hypothetical protein
MLAHAPTIGRPTKFNVQGKRRLTMKDLLENPTPYPTVVIPVRRNGYCSHCVCVVDDLIFDSITPYALRLHEDSFEWIFGVKIHRLHHVYRFANKCVPSGFKIYETYKRKIIYHAA